MITTTLVHDYLTQRGGAERVVLSMLKAFPSAPLYTSLYLREGTFPEFGCADVRPLSLNRVPALRRNHRLALPLLAHAFGQLTIHAEVTLCSSSGWSHGVRAEGRKVVYCYTPARWLYQPELYLGKHHRLQRGALAVLGPSLRRWDRQAAASANRYLTHSRAVRDRIRALYGVDAEILPAPYWLKPDHPRRAIDGIAPGFFLCVSRLLPYKNVDAVIAAFAELPRDFLVVVGDGPEFARLKQGAPKNVRLTGSVSDDQLAWLYVHCRGVLALAYEDYGLTALEAAAFGKPAAVLRWGGFLDTVRDEETGVFVDVPHPLHLRDAVRRLKALTFDANAIRAHARGYSEDQFIARLREIVLGEAIAAEEIEVAEGIGHGAS